MEMYITLECLWYCFNEIIQQDLEFVKLHWNTHHIRPSRHDTVSGKPDEVFYLPELSGGIDKLQAVSQMQLEDVVSQCDITNHDVDNDHQEYFNYVCDIQALPRPRNWQDALTLFNYLIVLQEGVKNMYSN